MQKQLGYAYIIVTLVGLQGLHAFQGAISRPVAARLAAQSPLLPTYSPFTPAPIAWPTMASAYSNDPLRSFSSTSTPSATTNPYDLLRVTPTATPTEIKRAYRRFALKLHPDVNPDPHAAVQFARIKDAYEQLLGENIPDVRIPGAATPGVATPGVSTSHLHTNSTQQTDSPHAQPTEAFDELSDVIAPELVRNELPAHATLDSRDGYYPSPRLGTVYYKAITVRSQNNHITTILGAYNILGKRIGFATHSIITNGQHYIYMRSLLDEQSPHAAIETDIFQEIASYVDTKLLIHTPVVRYTGTGIRAFIQNIFNVWDNPAAVDNRRVIVVLRNMHNSRVTQAPTSFVNRLIAWWHKPQDAVPVYKPDAAKAAQLSAAIEQSVRDNIAPHSFTHERLYIPHDQLRITYVHKIPFTRSTRAGIHMIQHTQGDY